MKIRTFINNSPEALDKEVNSFEESMKNDNGVSKVKASHTDMIVVNGVVIHKVVVFYNEV